MTKYIYSHSILYFNDNVSYIYFQPTLGFGVVVVVVKRRLFSNPLFFLVSTKYIIAASMSSAVTFRPQRHLHNTGIEDIKFYNE